MFIAIYTSTTEYILLTLDDYLEQPGRMELSDIAVICSLNPHF